MAWQRKTPFGYMIQNGEIIRHPQESGAVRDIFARYLLGESYSQIAGEMERLGIRYHQHTPQWNKHMVKRILENERYLGAGGYPRLVEDRDFHRPPTRPTRRLSPPSGKRPCARYAGPE